MRAHIRCSSDSIFFKSEQIIFFKKKLKLHNIIYFKIHSRLSFVIQLGLEGSGATLLRQIKMQGTLTYLLWRFERHKIKTVPIRIWFMFPWDILFKSKGLGISRQTNMMKIRLLMINSRLLSWLNVCSKIGAKQELHSIIAIFPFFNFVFFFVLKGPLFFGKFLILRVS